MDQLFDISGRSIIVTGGYGQIGRTLINALLDRGANVTVIEPQPTAERTAAAFGARATAPALLVAKGDVTNRALLEEVLAQSTARFGAPHGLVNNAAIDAPPDSDASETGPFENFPERSWDKVMTVNVKGVFLCCQVFGAPMAAAGRGSIINVASIYGAVSPDQSLYQYRRDAGEVFFKPVAYSASKSALYNLTRYIAAYWGGKGVRANTVTYSGVFNHQDPRFLANYGKKIPLRRRPDDEARGGMAAPEDYVGANIYLLSDASSYMTGADLRLDGGFLAL
jgi:NAD(P)-dependent dehydrogenase (short-subunit alcohol dehydrogenase family)